MAKIFWSILIILAISCNKDEEFVGAPWDIVKVDAPQTGNRQQPIDFVVHWPYSNGCDLVDRFEEVRSGNIITIIALGHTSPGFCTMDAGIKTTVFSYTPTSAGTFEFRFMRKDKTAISHLVTIN